MNYFLKIIPSIVILGLLVNLGYQKGAHSIEMAGWDGDPQQHAGGIGPLPFPFNPLPGRMMFHLNGIPVEVRPQMSGLPVETLRRQCVQDWQNKGYKVSEHNIGEMAILSAVDPQAHICETQMMLALPEGNQTMVIPASFDLANMPPPEKPKSPIYPDSRLLYQTESHDLQGNTENVMLLSDAGADRVMYYYRERFLQEGWQIDSALPPAGAPGMETLLFNRGTEERWVTISRQENGEEKTLIWLMHIQR